MLCVMLLLTRENTKRCVIGLFGLESKELDGPQLVARPTTTILNRRDELRRQPVVEVALLKSKGDKTTFYHTATTSS